MNLIEKLLLLQFYHQSNFAVCVNEYYQDHDKDNRNNEESTAKEVIYKVYRVVLDSKSTDETLVS